MAISAARAPVLATGPVTLGAMFATGAFARALTATVIPIEALAVLGSARNVSIVYFAVALTNLAIGLFIPFLVHRLKRRRVYWLGIGLAALAPLLLWASGVGGLSLGMLARAYGSSCLMVVQSVYLMELIKKRQFVRSEPIRLSFGAAAWGFGPAAGMTLYAEWGPWSTFLLAAGFALAELVWFRLLRLSDQPTVMPRTTPPVNPLRFVRRFASQPRLRLAWTIAFSRSCWWVALTVYGPIYMVNSGAGEVAGGWLVSAGNLALFSVMGFGWLARRIGVRQVIRGAFVLAGCATLAVVPLFPWPWAGAAALVAAAFGAAALDAVGGIPFLRAVRHRERAEMTMVYLTFINVSEIAPAALFAILLTLFDLEIVFAVTGCLLLWAAWMARWVPRGM